MFFATQNIAYEALSKASLSLQKKSFDHMPTLKADRNSRKKIGEAIWTSGIVFSKGSYAWLHDERITAALMIAHEMHDGKPRKNNPSQPRIVHELRTAHEVFNSKRVSLWLANNKYDPLLGAFCAVAHDIFENHRDANIKRLSRPQIEQLLAEIWEDHNTFRRVIMPAARYMTDDSPTLEKEARLQSQKAKGYNANGKFILGVFHQHLRFYDKLDHVISDHINTTRQRCMRTHNPENYIGDEGLLVMLEKSLLGAVHRRYVMDFPDVAKEDKRKYTKAITGLKLAARRITVEKDVADIMRIPPFLLAKHWIKCLLRISQPPNGRPYCPLLVPARTATCSRQTNNRLQFIHKTP